MKNYIQKILNKILDIFFKTSHVDKKYLEKLIQNRHFFNQKDDIFSLLPYRNQTVRKAILDLKFRNNIKNAEIFGELLFENLADFFQE